MLRELLLQRSTSGSEWVHSIVDRNLAIFVVEPGVNILTTLLQYLLTKQDRRGRSVNEEVVLRNVDVRPHRSTTIVAKVEDSGFDTQPENL